MMMYPLVRDGNPATHMLEFNGFQKTDNEIYVECLTQRNWVEWSIFEVVPAKAGWNEGT